MKVTDMFLAQPEREAIITRRILEKVPILRNYWRPYVASMPLGDLAGLVAHLPSWIAMTIRMMN